MVRRHCFLTSTLSFLGYQFIACSSTTFGDETSLLQVHTSLSRWAPDSQITASTSAVGASHQRWVLYSAGVLPDNWPDACFGSITKGVHDVINVTLASQWKKASCSCRDSMNGPPKIPVKQQLVTYMMSATAPLENYARTVAINSLLEKLLASTPNAQVVTLGAGLDGRFYSLPALKRASRLFEMDGADMQELKQTFVKNCNLKPMSPGGVRFLNLELNADNVYKNLFNDPSFDKQQPVIFLSEAVFQYLPEESVKTSLKHLADIMRHNPDSRLIVQSWLGDKTIGSKVDQDMVLFEFPEHEPTRKEWLADAGLTANRDVATTQAVLDDFHEQTTGLPLQWALFGPNEWMEVLSPIASS